jgi:hypothetical protein
MPEADPPLAGIGTSGQGSAVGITYAIENILPKILSKNNIFY